MDSSDSHELHTECRGPTHGSLRPPVADDPLKASTPWTFSGRLSFFGAMWVDYHSKLVGKMSELSVYVYHILSLSLCIYIYIHMYVCIGVSINGDTPKWMVVNGTSY